MSIGIRVKGARVQNLDNVIWRDRTLVRAWCMRRTMFLVPSDDLAVFVRGTVRRSVYNYRYALARVSPGKELDRLLDALMEVLDRPRTRMEIAQLLNESKGYRLKSKAGGGWGSKRAVPWVEAGGLSLPVGFLLHVLGARDVICSGPNRGMESTYVRADKWVSGWKDVPTDEAERSLLRKYLSTYGPATLSDFALWMGMYVRDAKEIWAKGETAMASVKVAGRKGSILLSDLPDLKNHAWMSLSFASSRSSIRISLGTGPTGAW